MFVNDTALDNASLDTAVQALKGAPQGDVRIGVSKPLPVPEGAAGNMPGTCYLKYFAKSGYFFLKKSLLQLSTIKSKFI